MKTSEAIEVLYQHVLTEWAARTPLVLGTEAYTPDPAVAWARLYVRHSTGRQQSIGGPGNRRWDRRGTAHMQIFQPISTGGDRALALLTDTAETMFVGRRIAGTTLRFRDVRPLQLDAEDVWNPARVEADFEYEEVV